MNLTGYELIEYVEQSADCSWIFAVFSKVNGPNDVEHVFSFRDKDRTTFGYKKLEGNAWWGRNVRKLARNIIAKKSLRQALLSDDPTIIELWKRTRA